MLLLFVCQSGEESLRELAVNNVAISYITNNFTSIDELHRFLCGFFAVVHLENDWYCHCVEYTKEHKCAHFIAVKLLREEHQVPHESLQFKSMNKKRRAGRPAKSNKYGVFRDGRTVEKENDSDDSEPGDGDGGSVPDMNDESINHTELLPFNGEHESTLITCSRCSKEGVEEVNFCANENNCRYVYCSVKCRDETKESSSSSSSICSMCDEAAMCETLAMCEKPANKRVRKPRYINDV